MGRHANNSSWSGEDAYCFAHELFREAAKSLCSEAECASLSALAFEIIQADHVDAQRESTLRELLIHARAARKGHLPASRTRKINESEARLLARAAQFESGRNNVSSAVEIHQDLARLESAPSRTRVEALIGAGRLLNQMGATTRAADMLKQAVAQATACDDPGLECQARLRLGSVLRRRGDSGAMAELLRAEELGRSARDDLAVADCLNERGMVYDSASEHDRADECYVAAERVYRRKGKLAGVCRVLGNLASTQAGRGQFDAALASLGEAEDIADLLGDARLQGLIHGNRGNVLSDLGDQEAAGLAYNKALTALRSIGDWRGVVATLANVGALHQERNELDAAESCFHQAEQAAREIGDARLISRILGNRGAVLAARGVLGQARALYSQALQEARALSDRQHEIVLLSNIAAAFRQEGKFARALKTYDEAISAALTTDARQELAELYTHRACTLESAGDAKAAQKAALAALEYFEQTGAVRTRCHFLCLMVLVSFEHGRANLKDARFLAVDARELANRLELTCDDRNPDVRRGLELLARLRPKSARIPENGEE